MSRQIIVSGIPYSPNKSVATYNLLMGGEAVWGLTADRRQLCPTHINLHTFRVSLSVAPGVGKSYTFTVERYHLATPLSVTISGNDTTGADLVHALGVPPNIPLVVSCTPSGVPAETRVRYSVICESVLPRETILIGRTHGSYDDTGLFFSLPGKSADKPTEFHREILIPTPGTLKKFYANGTPGEGDSFTYMVRLNGGDTALTCTTTGLETGSHDTTHSVAVVPEDAVCLRIDRAGPSPNETKHMWGVVFVPDNDGEFIIPMSGWTVPADGEFAQVTVGDNFWFNVEAEQYQLANAFTMKKIYVEREGIVGRGAIASYTLRKNGGATALHLDMTQAGGTIGSRELDVSIADGDLLTTHYTEENGPLASVVHISYLGYIPPAPSIDLGANF